MPAVVLVVDDNRLNMELTRDLLEFHGYEVLEATDSTECFTVLKNRLPDVVLMDVQLPGKDGLQITRELRADPRYADLLIIAMTAESFADGGQRVFDAGCDEYLTKPIDTRTLAEQIEQFRVDKPQRRVARGAIDPSTGRSHVE